MIARDILDAALLEVCTHGLVCLEVQAGRAVGDLEGCADRAESGAGVIPNP